MLYNGFFIGNERMEKIISIHYALFEDDYYVLTKNYRNNRGI